MGDPLDDPDPRAFEVHEPFASETPGAWGMAIGSVEVAGPTVLRLSHHPRAPSWARGMPSIAIPFAGRYRIEVRFHLVSRRVTSQRVWLLDDDRRN